MIEKPQALRAPGLSAPLDIFCDRGGVPHIRAATQLDAYFGQGFATARDRLWQLDLIRRTAAGRLAECFGLRALAGDRFQRTLGLAALARQKQALLEPMVRARLQAYAGGVNAGADAQPLPAEFGILGTQPEPWTVADVLLCAEFRSVVNASWRADLVLLQVVGKIGLERARDLFVEGELSDLGGDRIGRGMFATAAFDDLTQLVSASAEALRLIGLEEIDTGSNTWAIAGRHTITGKPLLANDLHMGYVVPNPNYLVHLAAPGLNVRGVSFPGIPGILSGHNTNIAWGGTALMADTQDLFLEEFDESGKSYRCADAWRPLQLRAEMIQVRDAEPVLLTVLQTHHGPVLRTKGRWGLSLQWERLGQPPGDPSLHSLNSAQNWDDFRRALTNPAIFPTDFSFACVTGAIGAQACGRIPIRANGDGAMPAPGATGRYDWVRDIPFDELPQDSCPESGLVIRANQKYASSGYHLSRRWHPQFRARRIRELLIRAAGRHSVASFARIQFDRESEHGKYLARRIDRAAGKAVAAQSEALDLIRTWDGILDPASAAAALVKECAALLKSRLFEEVLGKSLLFNFLRYWPAANLAVERILDNDDRTWLPAGLGTFDELLLSVVTAAAADLTKRCGAGPAAWRWGRLCPVRFVHPLAEHPDARGRFELPAAEVGSDGECVFSSRGVADYISSQQSVMLGGRDRGAAVFGASARLIWDLADWDNSSMLLNLGQSGNPDSPHFADHHERWKTGGLLQLPFSWERIEATAERKDTLVP